MSTNYFIGIDVGSGSVRAGLYSAEGASIYTTSHDIKKRVMNSHFIEQSSEDIFNAVCICIKNVVVASKISPSNIKGLAVDATCSLVCIDTNDNPVSINADNDDYWNIIMWMDHRAAKETQEINDTKNRVLDYVGSKVSVEMQIPKIKWLKNNLPNQYAKVAKFFDLADFLQYKFCNSEARSTCTVTCKWTYLAHENMWNKDFFEQCDLSELLDEKIGSEFKTPGDKAGTILEGLANTLGLPTDTTIGVGIIDAHAGVLGASGGHIDDKMIIIGGTSNCHMYNSKKQYFIEGVWGPYFNVIADQYWLNEGGQSAAGALIDYTIKNHSAYPVLLESLDNVSVYEYLNNMVADFKKSNINITEDLHILDYHHGNRSPRSNPELKGMLSGLSLSEDIRALAEIYLATIQSVCYGTRHIIETSISKGAKINTISVCGGILKNPIWLQELADVCQMNLEIPEEQESMLLGSAILAAKASGIYSNIDDAMKAMSRISHKVLPDHQTKQFHDKKYKVYLEMYEDQVKYKKIMTFGI